MRSQSGVVASSLVVALSLSVSLSAQSGEADRIEESAIVLEEIMTAPDRGIPRSILSGVEAIAVFPATIRGGFIVGGHRGRGIISVLDRETSEWSLPAFLTITGASFGLQIGGQSVDVVLLIMNRRGLERFLQNQFKIGADASVVAGPVGRAASAATDIQLRAEMLAYSRTRGLFVGVALEGSSVRQDRDANERYYNHPHRTREIVLDGIANAPGDVAAVGEWRDALAKYATITDAS